MTVGERDLVATTWLPIVDGLELVLSHFGDRVDDPVIEDVRALHDQALETLASLGYARHAETGVPFDPEQHEAVQVVPSADVSPLTVVAVLRPGYGDGPHQLRPAAVVVADGRL